MGSEEQNLPDGVRSEVEHAASKRIERILKPRCIKPPPRDMPFNHLVDIFTK